MRFRALPTHCDCSIPAHLHKDRALRHTNEHVCTPQLSLNITQIPHSTPETPTYSRNIKDTNRHHQTSVTTPKTSFSGWLGVSGVVWGCLVLSGGVSCCLELPGGVRGMSWVFWDAYMGVLGVSGAWVCQRGYLRAQSLQDRAWVEQLYHLCKTLNHKICHPQLY